MKKLINKEDKIFVAGSNGMVGKAICRELKINEYYNLLTPSRNELDLFNLTNVRDWFNKNQPSVVIVAAAKVGGILPILDIPLNFY